MVLVPVTPGNVEAYVAFLFEESDADGREYMATVDVRGFVLKRGRDRFYLEGGAPAASLTVGRTPRADGSLLVSVSITPRGGRAGPLLACLGEFLDGEEKTGPAVRRYQLAGPPDLALPEAELGALGFVKKPGRCKYVRDPGPPRQGEFPGAEKALAAGYAIHELTPAMAAAEPPLFAALADLYNRAFAHHPGAVPRDEAQMRERLTAPVGGALLAVRDGAITGYLHYTPMSREVLVGEIASLRRHWGTGSVDLMCRHVTQLVAERWGLPIVGYVDATNAPSRAAMERAGLRHAADYPVWEYAVEAGQLIS
ncbi:GNAT family N-acetyltransferase [Shumkonia mesophila]|uniref:GNAT family N-acetyltransferase n=1 Tax=Shumkonia mesophila TaxID=2838854 RepID=UPI002934AB23|nr:GNAT family N-acetyltransferase [Shumkonia mesophila]